MKVTLKNKERVLRQFGFRAYKDEKKICDSLEFAIHMGKFDDANKILQYGWNIRQVVDNYIHILQNAKYGFTAFKINESGWIEQPEWQNVEEIELTCNNSITIGQGLNGLYTYGFHADSNTCGHSCGLNEFLPPLSKKNAIEAALSVIKKFHEDILNRTYEYEGLQTNKLIAHKVLSAIKKFQQPVQATLF